MSFLMSLVIVEVLFSKLYYANQAVENHRDDVNIHPKFTDVLAEHALVKNWNIPPAGVPNRIKGVFPEDVHLINHQLPRPANATTVKLGEAGETVLMARVHYTYAGQRFGTNVTFSSRALSNNLLNMNKPDSKNGLVGEDATAAILYLHGGGTKSTGGHTAEGLVNHYKDFGVDVVSLDLSWHAEGHREILPNLEAEIKALSAFAQKYIPSKVPVFVWGHSWGAVWAEALMRMTDKPHSEFSFHHNLAGVMIMAPAVDAAPGKSMEVKLREYQRRIEDSRKTQSHLYAPREMFIWPQMVEQGKNNPINGLFSMLSIVNLDQTPPTHKGENFIPALMVVGKGDPLVYVGFESLFDVYKKLQNVDAHFLNELPIKDTKPPLLMRVGHLLREYVSPDTQIPIDIKLASDFIARHIGAKKLERQNRDLPYSSFISTVQEYANNLAFREYVNSRSYFVTRSTKVYGEVSKAKANVIKDMEAVFENYFLLSRRLKNALEKLASSKDEQEYIEALEEIQKLSHPDFLKRLSNGIVVQELRTLYDEVLLWNENGSSIIYEINQAQVVRRWANSVLNNRKLKNFFNQKAGKKIQTLIRRVIEVPDVEIAIALVKAEQLPEEVESFVLAKIVRIFEMIDVLNDVYVPTFESIVQRSTFDSGDKDRIESRISGINNNVERRKVLQTEIGEFSNQLRKLRSINMELLKAVRHNTRIIKEAFDESDREVPDSLREAIAASKEELDRLVNASDTLGEAVENVFVAEVLKDGQKAMSLNVFSEVISKYMEDINEFASQYENYAIHRRHLRRDLIVAIEKGEMGEEYKEAVLGIYGEGSGGHRPLVGAKSLYLQLEKNMEDMAKLEANLYERRTSLSELNLKYQEFFTSLLQLIQLRDPEDMLGKIPDVHMYYSNTIRQMLTKRGTDHSTPQEQREELLDYVKNSERDFQQIYSKEWKKEMKSDLPPLLPTSGAVEF